MIDPRPWQNALPGVIVALASALMFFLVALMVSR